MILLALFQYLSGAMNEANCEVVSLNTVPAGAEPPGAPKAPSVPKIVIIVKYYVSYLAAPLGPK